MSSRPTAGDIDSIAGLRIGPGECEAGLPQEEGTCPFCRACLFTRPWMAVRQGFLGVSL